MGAARPRTRVARTVVGRISTWMKYGSAPLYARTATPNRNVSAADRAGEDDDWESARHVLQQVQGGIIG